MKIVEETPIGSGSNKRARCRCPGIWVTAVAAPVIALATALPAHYPNHFDTLSHLGPIYLATGVLVVGALLALPGVLTGRGQPK